MEVSKGRDWNVGRNDNKVHVIGSAFMHMSGPLQLHRYQAAY